MAADLLNERLPPDWSYGVTGDGRVFFISERQQETSWLHPVTGRPVQTGHQAAPGLPNGWEQDYTPEGVTYFIDHNNKQTSFGHPVTGRPVSEENPPPPPRSPPQSPLERPELRRGTTNAKQRSIKAPSAKRNPNAQVVRRGFLYRLESGGISRAWKRRWCVLADFALFIYKGDDERSALGSVLLPSYRISRCTAEDPVQKEFAFKVEHENTKTVYFHTDTQTDLNSWLSNLQMAATMKGNSGFYREPNNNVKRDPTGMAQQSPPYANQRSDYPDRLEPSPQDSSSNFHPQWKNPNPAPRQEDYRPSPPQNSLSEQPSWRSVPDLEEDGRGLRGEENGPRGSLQSLPREGVRGQVDPSLPRLHPEARNYPHYQSYDPRLVRRDMLEQDPRGSVRSLQPDPRKNVPEFVPLGHFKTAGGDRDSYSQPGFQPYQPPHPQQRSSMVSDPGRQEGQGSPQRSPREGNTGSLPGAYQPRYPSLGEMRNEPFLPDHNRQASDGSARNRNSSSWRGSTAGPSEFQPQQRDSRSYPDPGRGYPDQYDGYPDPNRGHIDSRNSYPDQNRDRGYPDPQRGYPDQRNSLDRDRGYPDQRNSYAPQEGSYSVRENQRSRMQDLSREGDRFDSNPRLNTSRDPRASYASSRHSLASQGYGGDRDRDNLGSKQNLFPPHGGSRSSLSRLPPNSSAQSAPLPHNAQHGHTYVNVPEMRGAAQVDSPPPERPPYPAEVRDQIVRDLADTRSPGTAETMLKAHEMNKERMQRSEFFQYPTPPRDNTVSRLDDSRGSDPVKRLSQYSNRSSVASNSAMRNNNSSNVGNPPHPASMREFPEGGRRQDSGSGRFSDSFERHSDERRTEDPGRLSRREQPGEMPPPDEQRFGGDPEAKTLRQAYERVQSFRQSSAADVASKAFSIPDCSHKEVKLTKDIFYTDAAGEDQKGEPPSTSRTKQGNSVNFFEYSLNSQVSADHPFSMTDQISASLNLDVKVKPRFSPVSRLDGTDGGLQKDDLNMSQNTTLSPSGSYHHIDRDINQLYSRGSAFRPPSSASGSIQSQNRFHSLPRSYKFRAPDSQKDTTAGKRSRPRIPDFMLGDRSSGTERNLGRQWNMGQQWTRTVSELDLHHQQHSKVGMPANEQLMKELRERFRLVEPPQIAPDISVEDSDRLSIDGMSHLKPHQQSRSERGMGSREADIPTPTSLSSHPFFVPEDQLTVPGPADHDSARQEHLSPRSRMDKELKADLDEGVYAMLKAREGMNRRPIQTVREEPDMPDNEVLETKLKKKYPLNGTRLRMSISAGDLIGKTHDELVLLLIQLRRNQAALEKARDFYRESLYKKRPAEREYRRQIHDSVGRLERSLEEGHQSFVDIRSQLEEVEKKLEVYRPLINLVDNMVTMGSLYGGDNLMLATQYRKHLLRPDQYQAPRKMLEFSRQHQEARVVSGIQNDVRQLTAAEVDLEEKIERLNQLERLLQEQSFKVSSFREDKELLEKALTDIQRQMREGQDGPREYRRLQQQQQSVEKELSRVTQELAEASKALEETTVENSKIEHEVALLRTKVHGELKRSKSAPSLATDSANTKVKMERELARVQNMLQGLSQQGEKLSQQMSTIRRSSSGTQLAAAFDEAEKSRKVGTYLQTDLDSGDQIDLAQQIPGQSPASTLTPASPLTPSVPFMAEDGAEVPLISHQRQETTYGINSSMSEGESRADWDIGDADDNTKRFYGLLPKEKPRGLTVRDVKRQSEQRRERKRDEEGQEIPLRVSSTDDDTTTFIHARYPSYTSSQSSGLDLSARDPSAPLYENLPRSGSMPSLNGSAPSSRRSSISLLAPKPFTPYQDRSAKPFRSELVLNSTENPMDLSQGSGFASSKPFASDMALNSGWSESVGVENGQSLNREPQTAGDVGIVSARPLQLGRSADNIFDMQPGVSRSVALPTYTRVPQPFRREPFNLSQSTPHLNSEPSSLPSFTSSLPPSEAPSRPAFKSENTSSLYTPRPWGMERTDSQPGLYDVKKSPKGRYMTVSSSQPAKMEPGALLGSGVRSSAGDLISNARVDDVPDVVKSSLTNVDKIDQMNEDMIDREVLYFPEKVLIPERYDAEADAEHLTESQKRERQEKADRIKRLLTNQSVLSMSQPDVNHIPPAQLHNQLQREKKERAHILSLNQELARQVTQQTKKAAAARRKTWSGGQIADIKAQYEAEQAASQGQFDNLSRASRQANVLL